MVNPAKLYDVQEYSQSLCESAHTGAVNRTKVLDRTINGMALRNREHAQSSKSSNDSYPTTEQVQGLTPQRAIQAETGARMTPQSSIRGFHEVV